MSPTNQTLSLTHPSLTHQTLSLTHSSLRRPSATSNFRNPTSRKTRSIPAISKTRTLGTVPHPLDDKSICRPRRIFSALGKTRALGTISRTPDTIPSTLGTASHPLDDTSTGLPRRISLQPLIPSVTCRPNTTMHFDVSNVDSSTRTKSSLHPQGIAQLLRHYPDKQFVDNLVTIAQYGTRVGYEGPLVRTQRPNHSSAYANVNVINEIIQSELAKGRIMEIPSLPSQYFCSPVGLVPKKSDGTQTGWRIIFDLSCPEFSSVNDGIPKEYGAIIYETLQDAMNIVAKAGRDATMMKRDLKSAFRHIPVNSRDYWLLIFEWQGKYYVDLFLPFGLRTAPRIFNLFSEALHWIFETLFRWNLTHYLDDFLFVFKPQTDLSAIATSYNEILAKIGLTPAPEKDMNGTTVIHLGFEIDSLRMEVRLPRNKHSRALHTVTDLLKAKSITYSMLDEALGFLSHCCQVVPLGRPFLRNIFSALRHIPSSRPFRICIVARAMGNRESTPCVR